MLDVRPLTPVTHAKKIGFSVLIIVGILSFLFVIPSRFGNQQQERSASTKALSNAKQVGLALKLYSLDHEGNLPESLHSLLPDYLADERILENIQFMTPSQNIEKLSPETIMLRSISPIQGRIVIIYASCAGELKRQ